ncbi:nitroreductase/quinone reductase family protein [Candidatus Frankia alpina]|uniref:Nitroreductase family deazaflavin-dependent oxidoreductase n=1 Tax=Candidatus Frankia alpina TaxID=2699483 RepID=A0A4S5BYN0_9ACTN|nr:nitroreductase/quinone reductase family protein [Candidatus Frankia alpina]THJ38020.1 nitroreductase family deazaflavin-dependent oxidoreductase [Candidatus Frankia alpina]
MSDRDWSEQNRLVIGEFRANAGKVGGYFADGDRYVVFASVVGEPTNPAWYYNLLANPDVTVEVGTEVFPATAAVATGDDRDRFCDRHAAQHPQWATYQTRTTRRISVIMLVRRADAHSPT